MEVIPAILAKTFSELKEKIRQVESYVNWVQLDILDGNFAPNLTWNNPQELDAQDFSVFLEAHLMVLNPDKILDAWLASGIKRIIVHIEAVGSEKSHTKTDPLQHKVIDMSQKVREAQVQFGLALNPETPISAVKDFLDYCDLVLLLAVSPGFGGQKFKEEVLPKISEVRKITDKVKIEVDGGINLVTGKKCAEAGADILVSNSYIFNSDNIKKAILDLQNITVK